MGQWQKWLVSRCCSSAYWQIQSVFRQMLARLPLVYHRFIFRQATVGPSLIFSYLRTVKCSPLNQLLQSLYESTIVRLDWCKLLS
uniref:Uncharacterized protein n=1 Tax=Anguilla anguilla TaxID=7936 RepID=A0A0E9RQ70_ANGAN